MYSASSPLPHLLNQVPPGAQQLSVPTLLMIAHLEHTVPIDVTFTVISVDVEMWSVYQHSQKEARESKGDAIVV